jgi:acyl-CoA synthetase (NDP forming)
VNETALSSRMQSLHALLDPRSIAVVGASSDPGKAGGRPLHYMLQLGFRGALYPVNPNRSEILGLRSYPSLAALPSTPDLCVIAVPAESVEQYVIECGELGIRGVIVFASGYAETGEEGRERQERLRTLALENDLALAGPNCLGFVNVNGGIAPTFTTALERRPQLERGTISFVSQSGAVGAFLLGMIQDQELGLSHFITTGNEAALGITDYIGYLLDETDTSVIAGYLEGVDGAELVRVATAALEADTPLVLMKVGSSTVGAAASAAHTGKLAGVDAVYDSVFRQHAITRAESLDDLLDFSRALAVPNLPRGAGIGIVSTSGGAAILIADWCERLGLDVVELAPETTDRLADVLPWFSAGRNPVDMTGRPLWDEEMLHQTLAAVADDPRVDAVLCHVGLAPGPCRRISEEFVRAAQASDKPFYACWLAEIDPEPHAELRRAGIPIFSDPVRMTKAAAAAIRYVEARGRAASRTMPATIKVTPPPAGEVVSEHEAKAWLGEHGLRSPKELVAQTREQALEHAERIGYPVCLKLLSPDVTHRSDIGAVRVGMATAAEVAEAHDAILATAAKHAPDARIEGMLVQEVAGAEGVELIVSGFRDSVFGPCVLCGVGGVLTEVFGDTVIRRAPVDLDEARTMLDELRGAALLRGPRGTKASDIGAAADAIVRIAALIAGAPDDVDTIEINPMLVFADGDGVLALDALVVRAGKGVR